ncbi:hypothetical protein GF325_03375 [Candidatus Bathyarchaeota archaeon]|nr:hypothetical protein [Candidatus Bathyarchaeota archaeon]
MGRKKQDVGKNIRKALLSSAKGFVQEIADEYEGLEYTQAADTFIMENLKEKPVEIDLQRDGKSLLEAKILWISQNGEGDVVLYLDNKRYLYPTPDTVKKAVFHELKKGQGYIIIETTSDTAKCLICGKPIEIFDEADSCPSCGALSHSVHLDEWVRMKKDCPSCGAKLSMREDGTIMLAA